MLERRCGTDEGRRMFGQAGERGRRAGGGGRWSRVGSSGSEEGEVWCLA